MNDEQLNKIWEALDSKITKLNDRTKIHTIQIKELQKQIKELKNDK